MRLRCARCGCYVSASREDEPWPISAYTRIDADWTLRVAPCARCLSAESAKGDWRALIKILRDVDWDKIEAVLEGR
jgi:hypothetical protein